jgi:hypothetical protein
VATASFPLWKEQIGVIEDWLVKRTKSDIESAESADVENSSSATAAG